MRYLIAHVKGGKVCQLDLDRLKPSARYVAKKRREGVEVEWYAIG